MAENNRSRKEETDLSSGGMLPPQAVEIEEAVLGGMLIEHEAATMALELLRPEDFYRKAHRNIFEVMMDLFEKSNPLDIITVENELRDKKLLDECGGPGYLSELTRSVSSAANIEYHAQILTEKAIKRTIIQQFTEVVKDSYDSGSDPYELLDKAEKSIYELANSKRGGDTTAISDILKKTLQHLEEIRGQKGGITGVPSGTDVDKLTAGWQPGDLIIIAARPSMGKTAFVLTIARNAALLQDPEKRVSVALFSLEMSDQQLIQRLLTMEARVDAQAARTGRLKDDEFKRLIEAASRLFKAKIFIDDTPALSVMEMRSKCRRLKSEHDIDLIIVDYLQLMRGNTNDRNSNREQEIATISRGLKGLAKELNVPVIALAQLSRAVEQRGGNKRPQLSDLRESGCLTGDTLILNPETGVRTPIRELAAEKGKTTVLGLDAGYKLHPYQASNVFYSGKKPVFELKLRSGKRIKASANHPFLKLGGWKSLEELAVGDRIATPRRLQFIKSANLLSIDELTLLAHLIGDGCILPKQPYHYTSQDLANLAAVSEAAHSLFGIQARRVPQKNWYHVYLPSPYHLTHGKKHPITHWYEQLGLNRVPADKKCLPESLFKCDEDHIVHFLHHLWATDGNVSWKILKGRKPSAAIYYATTSTILAEQIQHLLLRLGIRSQISQSTKQDYKPSHIVKIQGRNLQLRFLKKVGCFGKRGEIVPELIEALETINATVNIDVIPKEAWTTVVNGARTKANLSWRAFQAQIEMKYCGSALFKNGISRARMRRIASILPVPEIEKLAESEVFWDEIQNITPLGLEEVYDITVPDVHNFVANDIVVHNSIEQDADVVCFLYRPEYYGITADEEGKPTEGIGEVIIGKQRNGPVGDVKLQFVKEYARFENLTSYDDGGFDDGLAIDPYEDEENDPEPGGGANLSPIRPNSNPPPPGPDDIEGMSDEENAPF